MHVGRTFEKVPRVGSTVVIRTCAALSKTSAFLAAVMGFLARRSERMAIRYRAANSRLERGARWLNAKATGVPLGVDVAGDDWEEPALLPLAEPPPIPPAAFFRVPPPAQDEEWATAILAAKTGTPAPEPTEEDWEAALRAAKEVKEATAPAPAARNAAEASPSPAEATAPRASAPRPLERRVGPRPIAARATGPHITLREGPPLAGGSGPKPITPVSDPKAVATRKAIEAALRS
jgi:hypothetical protein